MTDTHIAVNVKMLRRGRSNPTRVGESPRPRAEILVENLPRRVEVIITAKRRTKSGMGCSKCVYGYDGEVCTNFCPYSVLLQSMIQPPVQILQVCCQNLQTFGCLRRTNRTKAIEIIQHDGRFEWFPQIQVKMQLFSSKIIQPLHGKDL